MQSDLFFTALDAKCTLLTALFAECPYYVVHYMQSDHLPAVSGDGPLCHTTGQRRDAGAVHEDRRGQPRPPAHQDRGPV